MPFGQVYLFSYVFKFILADLLRYRRQTVFQNLRRAFPAKDEKELKEIAQKFYMHYSMVFLETLKIVGMNYRQFEKRISIANPEVYKIFRDEPRGAVILTGHLGNFEWAGQWMPRQVPHPIFGAYRPFTSPSWEYVMQKLRSKHGTKFIPNKQFIRATYDKSGTGLYMVFLNDQLPAYSNDHCWVSLFNTDTMFFVAPAKIAVKYKLPVYFIDMWRIKKGYYKLHFQKIVDDPASLTPEKIIRLYVEKLEEAIRQRPYAWLWSHKRWKRSKENDPTLTIKPGSA